MLGVKWFSGKLCPIGVDFGSESLKLVQLSRDQAAPRIVAAGRFEMPESDARDPAARTRVWAEGLKELLGRHPFKGRKVVTSVPSEHLFVQHIRLARMNEQDLARALPYEAQGSLPFPVRDAVLRHLVAGELTVDNEPKTEVILMAAPRQAVENQLSALARAKLDVQTVLVPPLAILEAFRFLFTRQDEQDMVSLFVDIGASHTCAVVTQGMRVVFVKQFPAAGQTFSAAAASRLNCTRAQARRLRIEWAGQAAGAPGSPPPGGPSGATATAVAAPPGQAELVEAACREHVDALARELGYCARYYQSLHPDRPIERVIFLGGEAHHRGLCQRIARALCLPAQLGDPMLRMHRTHQGVDCGDMVVGTPAPEWAVAFGCSLAETEAAG